MNNSFGEQLYQFALSADIITCDIFNNIFNIVSKYTKDAMFCDYLEMYLIEYNNESPVLDSYDISVDPNYRRQPWNYRLQDDEGNLIGQIAYVFTKKQPLWITGQDGNLLSKTENYMDHWGNVPTDKIPRYRIQGDNQIRSSISFPLFIRSQSFGRFRSYNPRGVLTFESKVVLEPTEDFKKELLYIVNAISLLYRLAEHNELLVGTTRRAADQLDEYMKRSLKVIRAVPLVGKPLLFLATSARSPDDVVGEIKTIMAEDFSRVMRYYHWEEDNRAGQITDQLWEKIKQARYGIFYVSEKDDIQHPSGQYKDNLNVLYEAGMMYAQQEEQKGAHLIFIREENSPPIPFDLTAQRRIIVPRSSDRLIKESFRNQLSDMLNCLS